MVAHVAGNVGGPPPPTEREARLEAENAQLRADLVVVREELLAATWVLNRIVAATHAYLQRTEEPPK